jgi:hypothetical protein
VVVHAVQVRVADDREAERIDLLRLGADDVDDAEVDAGGLATSVAVPALPLKARKSRLILGHLNYPLLVGQHRLPFS